MTDVTSFRGGIAAIDSCIKPEIAAIKANRCRLNKAVTEHDKYAQAQFHPSVEAASEDIVHAVTADLVAASVTSMAVSPVVAICDIAVVHAASKRVTMTESIRHSLSAMTFRPWAFFGSRGFGLVWGVYTLTCARLN